jgi:hypothetical protein
MNECISFITKKLCINENNKDIIFVSMTVDLHPIFVVTGKGVQSK